MRKAGINALIIYNGEKPKKMTQNHNRHTLNLMVKITGKFGKESFALQNLLSFKQLLIYR